jgi:hypothetical protein
MWGVSRGMRCTPANQTGADAKTAPRCVRAPLPGEVRRGDRLSQPVPISAKASSDGLVESEHHALGMGPLQLLTTHSSGYVVEALLAAARLKRLPWKPGLAGRTMPRHRATNITR